VKMSAPSHFHMTDAASSAYVVGLGSNPAALPEQVSVVVVAEHVGVPIHIACDPGTAPAVAVTTSAATTATSDASFFMVPPFRSQAFVLLDGQALGLLPRLRADQGEHRGPNGTKTLEAGRGHDAIGESQPSSAAVENTYVPF
jgi:hypothetical protein